MSAGVHCEHYLLSCAALVVSVLVGAQAACDVNCAGQCLRYGSGTCDATCKIGFGLNITSHTCGVCESLCLSACNIKGPGTCDIQCQPGYCPDWTTRRCQAKANCLSCATAGYPTCDSCTTGYTAYQGNCYVPSALSCDANCAASCLRYGPGKCDATCKTGFGLNVTSRTCGACESLCLSTCNVKGPGTCDLLCQTGYCPDWTTRRCQAKANCVSCASAGFPTCDSCTAGFVIYQGNCLDPSALNCDANCAGSCLRYGPGKCDANCKTGFGLNIASHTCGACESLCLSACNIKGPGTCDVLCQSGYCPDWTTRLCRAKANCIQCTTSGYPTCDSCTDGYTLYRGNCSVPSALACDPNCASSCLRNGPGMCDSMCKAGYGLDLITHKCGACDNQCSAESACNYKGPGTCDRQCKGGFCLDTSTFRCFVKPHCKTCVVSGDLTTCSLCETGYIVQQGSCTAS